jgi:hypothetical protein
MMIGVQAIVRKLDGRNAAASKSAVERLSITLGKTLPLDYVEYLRTSNGAAGAPSEGEWIVLWSAKEVIEFNEAYGIKDDFGPWLVVFGTDGGDTGYAFDTRKTPFAVVALSFSSLDPPRIFAPTFGDFLRKLARQS